MGDAKRRKQKHPDYGQFYQINSIRELSRHLERLNKEYRLQSDQLQDSKRFLEFMEARKDSSRTIEETIEDISQFLIGDWLSQQLRSYSETDGILLAAFLYQLWISTEQADDPKFWIEDYGFGAMQCHIISFLPWLAQIDQAVINKAEKMSQTLSANLSTLYQDALDFLEKIQSTEKTVNQLLENSE
jgi:hypothetical protein